MPGDTARENGKLGGRPRLEATKLREALVRMAEEKAEELSEAIYNKAISGDVPALKEIFDRGLGKAPAKFEADGEDGIQSITITFTKPDERPAGGQDENPVRAP